MTDIQRQLGRTGQPGPIARATSNRSRGTTGLSSPLLIEALRQHAAERPFQIAFTRLTDDRSKDVTLTFEQLDRRARAIAAALLDISRPGHRVLLAFPPGLDFITAFFGCLYAGCVAVPVYPPRPRTVDRFRGIALDADAVIAISDAASITQFKAMFRESDKSDAITSRLTWIACDEVPDQPNSRWTPPACGSDSLAMLQYTSGSTSTPKGVMLTHANLAHNTLAISHAFEVPGDATAVFWLPSYHDMGLIGGILSPVLHGQPATIMAPAMFLQNPFLWLDTLSKNRANISGGPNFAYDLCVRKITPEQRATLDLSAWSLAFTGAEAIQPATLERFAETFAPCGFRREAFYPCYGLAEATLLVAGPKPGAGATIRAFDIDALKENRAIQCADDAPNARRLVGCGSPISPMRVAIVDTLKLTPARPGTIGEIWVAGPSVAQGYWRNLQKTEQAFNAVLGDADGPYLRTGDLGFFHENQLYITGRNDDLIIVRGLNHHPQDLESTARDSHKLLQNGLGAAFAVEEHGNQRLVLVHEIERDGTVDLTPVLTAIRNAILDVHGLALDAVLLIRAGTIAKTSSGKVQRHASKITFVAGQLRPIAEYPAKAVAPVPALYAASPALAAVCQHAITMSGASLADVTPETPIASLGLDSLQKLELVAALDKTFAGHLPDTAYSQAITVGELAGAVQKHLIDQPHSDTPALATPPEHFDISLFPEYLELKRHERALLAVAGSNPYFHADQGRTDFTKPSPGGVSRIDGRELVNFCAYDYVGMAHDPHVIAATKAAIDRFGTGAGASRLVSGEKQIHRDLEDGLASFLGTPKSIVFVSGHATNVATIGHLMSAGDLILHDMLAHNSILQGARLSRATCRAFPHNNWRALDDLLAGVRHNFRRVLIAIEGVYSMDGDYPDLPQFIEVKKRHKALMLVDEAHSLGTMGPTGRGIGEVFGVDRADVELWMGTLSKSLASCGGYIAGSEALVEYLKYTAPSFVYSVGISPPNAAASLAALTLLAREPQRVARLHELAALFLQLAQQRGLDTGTAKGTPIIPIIIGNSVKCLLLARTLSERGINVQPILHPAVPEHATRLRFFITTNHTEQQIRDTVNAIANALAVL